jgi:hypothetical protein
MEAAAAAAAAVVVAAVVDVAGQTGSPVVVGFLEYRDVPPVSFSFDI